MDYDATWQYPRAMWDDNSLHAKQIGYAFTVDMNDELYEKVNIGNFNQVSAILKVK